MAVRLSRNSAFGTKTVCMLAMTIVLSSKGWALSPATASQAGAVFRSRCTGCHTYGQGIKVGPDLKGVTARRQRPWLVNFIRSSSQLISRGDPSAVSLFRQFRKERMPDWGDLSPQQVEAILDYFAADGPTQKAPDERHASTATAGEIEMGRWLFEGKIRLSSGTHACITCHSMGAESGVAGGSFGPDLGGAYLKYQDRALTNLLRRPFSFHVTETKDGQLLTPVESFDLKAYMGKAAGLAIPAPAS